MSHAIEPELLEPAPRRNKWRWNYFLPRLGFELISLPFTLVAIFAFATVSHEVALAAYGRVVPAKILKLERIYIGHESFRCCINYSYLFRGVTYTRRSDVDTNAYSQFEAGAQPNVKILPVLPQWNSWPFTGAQPKQDSLLIPLSFLVIFVGILCYRHFSFYREIAVSRRLVARGKAVTGEVIVRSYPVIGSLNCLKYNYSPESLPGIVCTGKAILSKEQRRGLKLGKFATVLYDPENPACSILYLAAYHDACF